jgi:xanthine dehydrogenase molybdopterin-binding subunit B
VCGNTSRGIFPEAWFEAYCDISRVEELSRISLYESHVSFGSCVSINRLLRTLKREFKTRYPENKSLHEVIFQIYRIASRSIRNVASLGGNLVIAKKSPKVFPSDLATILATLGATLLATHYEGGTWVEKTQDIIDFVKREEQDPNSYVVLRIDVPWDQIPTPNILFFGKSAKRLQLAHSIANFGRRGDFIFTANTDHRHEAFKSRDDFFLWTETLSPTLGRISRNLFKKSELDPNSRKDIFLSMRGETIREEESPEIITKPDAYGYAMGRASYTDANVMSRGTKHCTFLLAEITNQKFRKRETFEEALNELRKKDPTLEVLFYDDFYPKTSRPTPVPTNYPDLFFIVERDRPTQFVGQPIAVIVTENLESIYRPSYIQSQLHPHIEYLGEEKITPGLEFLVPLEDLSNDKDPLDQEEIEKRKPFFVGDLSDDSDFMKLKELPYRLVIGDLFRITPKDGESVEGLEGATVRERSKTFDEIFAELKKENPYSVETTIQTGSQSHWYLETNRAWASSTEHGGVHIFSSTQSPCQTQKRVAASTMLPLNKILIEVIRVGGAFGGKALHHFWTACAVAGVVRYYNLRDELPCTASMVLDRETDSKMIGKKQAMIARTTMVADAQGKLKGYDLKYLLDEGCSPDCTWLVSNVALQNSDSTYFVENVHAHAMIQRTAKLTSTALRTFGVTDTQFVFELSLQRLAKKMNMDPDELREINFYQENQRTLHGQPLYNVVMDQLWKKYKVRLPEMKFAVKRTNETNRESNNHIVQGIATSCCRYAVSFNFSEQGHEEAFVNLNLDGTVTINQGGVEMGQGVHMLCLSVVKSVMYLPSLNWIKVANNRTESLPNAPSSGGAATSLRNSMVVGVACRKLRTEVIGWLVWNVNQPQPIEFFFKPHPDVERVTQDEIATLADLRISGKEEEIQCLLMKYDFNRRALDALALKILLYEVARLNIKSTDFKEIKKIIKSMTEDQIRRVCTIWQNSGLLWEYMIRSAYWSVICPNFHSSAQWVVPGISDISIDTKLGSPVYHNIFAACTSVVEVDGLTGELCIKKSRFMADLGRPLNVGVDLGQVEGGFMMGVGHFTTEEVVYEKDGGLANTNNWSYKPPFPMSIPLEWEVEFYNSAEGKGHKECEEQEPHPTEKEVTGFQGFKSPGELAGILASSVFLSICNAICTYRELYWEDKERASEDFVIDSPATTEKIVRFCSEK